MLKTLILMLVSVASSAEIIKKSIVEVRPYQATHYFKIEANENINNLQAISCHRHFYKNKDSKFLHFKENKTVEFKYQPVSIELENFCPLYFGIFGKGGLIEFGFIDFENPKYQLKGVILCNGELVKFNGVGVCQTKRELTQVIKLEQEATITGNCTEVMKGKEINIKASQERCTYFFKSGGLLGRVTLLAYDKVDE